MRVAMTRRPILIAALIAGASYYVAGAAGVTGASHTVWKGAGVALLALWAATQADDTDGWLLTAALALGALGDVLLEIAGFTVGGAAFLAGHLVAVALYWRNQRTLAAPDVIVAAIILVATPVLAAALPAERSAAWGIGVYAAGLGAMAATAWASRFPRTRVGLGALLFAMSDLLIFARLGPLGGSPLPGLLVWPLYFAGQALIATGVVRGLTR